MTLATYASIRQTTPDVTFTTASGGSLTAGSAWFCVQARNRVGKNLLSTPVQLTWTSGQKIVVMFGATARANGEEIFEYVISACPTNTPTLMKQVAAWRANDPLTVGLVSYPGQGLPKSLPATLELTTDAQIAISPSVANLAALPTTGMVYGAMRFVTGLAQYVRYDDEATTGLQAASIGYWVSSSQAELETYLASTVADGGCDQPLSSIAESEVFYAPPPYAGDGTESQPVRFWVSNGLSSSGYTMPAGMTIALQLFAAGREVSSAFASRVIVRMLGYVNRSTGAFLASPISDQITWAGAPLETPEDLLPGHAIVYELVFDFFQAELASVVTDGSKVLISFLIQGLLGTLDSTHALTGDVVLDRGDRLRIVPINGGIQRLSGVCLVGGYRSPFVGETSTSGLPADEPDLRVAISAALGAAITVLEPTDTLLDTEAVRAVVSTESGIQAPSISVAVATTGANPVISIPVTYPSAVRGDYPDIIGGMAAGFNVPEVIVYLQSGSTIYRQTPVIPATPGQTITIDSLGTVVGSLPTSDPDFGLFSYNAFTPVATNGASSLPNGTYNVRIAYSYPSPNTAVSKISHAVADGCIGEFEPLQDAINAASEVFADDAPPISATGTENDVFLEAAGNQLKLYKKNPVSWDLQGIVEAPPGVDGVDGVDGKNAYTTLTASFTQPALNALVTVTVADKTWMAVGMIVYIQNGGYYSVTQLVPTVQFTNLGYVGNAAQGATVGIGNLVTTGGQRGIAGSAAFTTLNAGFTQPGVYNPSSPATSLVTITVLDSAWMTPGQTIFIEDGGYYRVDNIISATSVEVNNLGYTGNAALGASITAGGKISPAGIKGADGTGGGGGGSTEGDSFTLTGGTAPADVDAGQATLYYSSGILNLVTPDGETTGEFDSAIDFVPILMAGAQTKWIPARDLIPSSSNGAGAWGVISAGSVSLSGMEFVDTGERFAEIVLWMPREFDALKALKVTPVIYGGGSGAGNTVWKAGIHTVSFGFSVTSATYSTPISTTFYTEAGYIDKAATPIIIPTTDFSASQAYLLQISRDPTDPSDDYGDSVYLLGLEFVYSTRNPNSSTSYPAP